jgi:hypothetical protein
MTNRDPEAARRDADDLRASDPKLRDQAAARIWRRFEPRLREAVTHRFDPTSALAGECDAVQGMFNLFMESASGADRRFQTGRDDAWKLLVFTAMFSVVSPQKEQNAPPGDALRPELRRTVVSSEQRLSRLMADLSDHAELTPDEAAIPREQFERLLEQLPADLQRIFIWRLEHCTNSQISGLLNRTLRTVELKLKILRKTLVRLVIPEPPPHQD